MGTLRTHVVRACAILCTLVLISGVAQAQQQRGSVTGVIFDEVTQQPLAAVQVFIIGTQLGSITDQRGRYVIPNVPAGGRQVRATILGYTEASQTVNVAAGGAATADFSLRQTAVELGGIVVNAITGEQLRRRELGNTVGNIELANLEKAAITRPADILTARVAGVEVRNINVEPDAVHDDQRLVRQGHAVGATDANALARTGGANGTDFMDSGFSEGSPDQVPNRFNDLNLDDIESIEVLKGPAASGIYGTAASNGVILIRTKRGSSGPARWTTYAEAGLVQEKNQYPDNLAALFRRPNGTYGRCRNYQFAGGTCAQDSIARFNPFSNESFSPFREGQRQKFGLSVAGGGEQVTYFVSGDVEKEDGVYESNFLKKYNLRANLRALVRDNLTFNVSTSYLSNDFSQPSNDNSVLSPILNGMFGRALFDHSNRARALTSRSHPRSQPLARVAPPRSRL